MRTLNTIKWVIGLAKRLLLEVKVAFQPVVNAILWIALDFVRIFIVPFIILVFEFAYQMGKTGMNANEASPHRKDKWYW